MIPGPPPGRSEAAGPPADDEGLARIGPVGRAAVVAAVAVLAALVATWPLALHLTTRVPSGTEQAGTIPLFSLWQLWWTADRLPHGFHHYLDAPIFFPNKGVTTYSEPMPLLGAASAPFWGLGFPPALTYNLVLLGVLVLNGVFCYRLLRALRTPLIPALAGTVLAVNLPFAGKALGVLPNLAFFGMFWALEGLVRFGRSGSARWAAWGGAGMVATYLTFQQYALFFAPLFAVAALVAWSEHGFGRQALLKLAVCGAATAVVIVGLAAPTIRLHGRLGLQRQEQLVKSLSARPGDFLSRPATALVPFPPSHPSDTAGLFPGLILVALAVTGAAAGLRRQQTRRWSVFFMAGAGVALVWALGLNLRLGRWSPFDLLRRLPGATEIRSPYRAAALVQVMLVPLATGGLVAVGQWVRRRRAALTVVVATALTVVAVAETASSRPLLAVPTTTRTAWTAWLAGQPPGTVLAHVPFPAGFTVARYEVEAQRMFLQIDHHRPLVNGYSGFFPVARGPGGRVVQAYLDFQVQMATRFPSEHLLCILAKNLRANLLAVDKSWLGAHVVPMNAVAAFLRPAYDDPSIRIYQLSVPPDKCRPGD